MVSPMESNTPLPSLVVIKPNNIKPIIDTSAPSGVITPPSEQYANGTRHVLTGLKSQPQFNGHQVVVTGFLFNQGRYTVAPTSSNSPLPDTMAIKTENLTPVNNPASAPRVADNKRRGLQKSFSLRGPLLMQTSRQDSDLSLSPNPIPEEVYHSGSMHELKGVRSAPYLNGKRVIVKAYIEEKGRYQVCPVDQSRALPAEFKVKHQNLVPVGSQSEPTASICDTAVTSEHKQTRPRPLMTKCYSQRSFGFKDTAPNNVDMSSSWSSAEFIQKGLPIGTLVSVRNSGKPWLEGGRHFRIVRALMAKRAYKLEPVDTEELERGGDINVEHDSLVVEGPEIEVKSLLKPSSRGVITGVSHNLDGHLVKVINYDARRKNYLVQPLGEVAMKYTGSSVMLLSAQNIKQVSPSAYWTTVTKGGKKFFLPCVAKLTSSRSGVKSIAMYISTFPGFRKVTAQAKILLGEDRCNWDDEDQVEALFAKCRAKNMTMDVDDDTVLQSLKDNEIVLRADKHAVIIDSLVEFELIEKTGRTLYVGKYGDLPIYKMNFSTTTPHSFPTTPSNATVIEDISKHSIEPDMNNSFGHSVASSFLSKESHEDESPDDESSVGSDNDHDDADENEDDRRLSGSPSLIKKVSSTGRLGGNEASSGRAGLQRKLVQGDNNLIKKTSSSRTLMTEDEEDIEGSTTSLGGSERSGSEKEANYNGKSNPATMDLLEIICVKERQRKQLDEEIRVLRESLAITQRAMR